MIVMIFAKMPTHRQTEKQHRDSLAVTFGRLFKNKEYTWGVIAQFFYVGAQIGVWSFTIRLVMNELDYQEAQAATIYLIAIIGFCTSRFVYTWLMKFMTPRHLLAIGSVLGAISALFVIICSGMTAIVSLVLISVFMSLMFPTIYGIALVSVAESEHPDDSKIGASGLIMAILGGAILTPLQGMVSDSTNINISFVVPLVCFLVVLAYATIICSDSKHQ